jgi:hypothetical protein
MTIRMRRASLLVSLWLTAQAACFRSALSPSADPFDVELTAMQDVLSLYRPMLFSVDSMFAQADQAPPAPTGRARPAARHRTLNDSLQSAVARVGGDSLRIRASEPSISGRRANISVTIDGRLARSGARRFYQTMALMLERDGNRWVVRERRELGIS